MKQVMNALQAWALDLDFKKFMRCGVSSKVLS
jgi:hypothetical protein